MTYRHLPPELHSTADSAKQFCREHWGITANRIKEELPIIPDVSYRPTLHAVMKDFHWLCIDISENPYPPGLDSFILDCKNRILPVRLFVAVPAPMSKGLDYEIRRAKSNGVGRMEVVNGTTSIVQDALSLSLTGLRVPDPREFPLRYRHDISDAHMTFISGNPSKGCATLYEQIEHLSRRIALKAQAKHCWKSSGAAISGINIERVALAKLLRMMMDSFDSAKCNCPELDTALFGRLLGATPHRNESAHKPSSLRVLKKRDRELRTRFEGGIDLLRDLIAAARPLKL
jgi:hypothetical protein